jgi:hypothetical protein
MPISSPRPHMSRVSLADIVDGIDHVVVSVHNLKPVRLHAGTKGRPQSPRRHRQLHDYAGR